MNIPNFVDIPVVNVKTGMLSPEWRYIMQQLIQTLQTNASEQGLVIPTQIAADIALIEGRKVFSPITPTGEFVTQFGTLLYDSTNNLITVALNNLGAPQFHTIVTL